jgi:hypothetical protein
MDLWRRKVSKKYLPLYEAKMIHQFDHRFATFDGEFRDARPEEKADPRFEVMPRYWVHEGALPESSQSLDYFLGFRDITNSTNERTVIASIVPKAGFGHTLPLVLARRNALLTLLLSANLNSLSFDYIARNCIGGTHLTFFILKQLPVLSPQQLASGFETITGRHVASSICELMLTSHSLARLSKSLGIERLLTPPGPRRQSVLKSEVDGFFFHLYGIPREDVDYIMETFPIVKRKDIKEHGSFRTKELILEAYDAMAEAERTGVPYQSPLDPPPANGWIPSDELIEEARRSLEQGEPA